MRPIILGLSLVLSGPAWADGPVVEGITASKSGDAWSFSVTVRHPDTGWDHYADGWEVALPGGEQIGFRKLLHPHENEQPFTRSLSGVVVPDGVTEVLVRAHDSVHGWGEPVAFELTE